MDQRPLLSYLPLSTGSGREGNYLVTARQCGGRGVHGSQARVRRSQRALQLLHSPVDTGEGQFNLLGRNRNDSLSH